MTIRLMETRDKETVKRLFWSVVENPDTWEQPKEDSLIFVAEKDGKVVGYAEVIAVNGCWPYVNWVVVDKDYQRKFVCWRLLEAVSDFCRWVGYAQYYVGVNRQNKRMENMADRFPNIQLRGQTDTHKYYSILLGRN